MPGLQVFLKVQSSCQDFAFTLPACSMPCCRDIHWHKASIWLGDHPIWPAWGTGDTGSSGEAVLGHAGKPPCSPAEQAGVGAATLESSELQHCKPVSGTEHFLDLCEFYETEKSA